MDTFYYKSPYFMYANQSLDWLPSDTKELFLKNLESRYDELKKYDWIDNHFTYKFDANGFRSNSFINPPDILYLGCSYTVGIGLPIESTWAYLSSKKLNMSYVNLGVGGSGCDTAFRLGLYYISKIKPKIVFFLQPPQFRIETINQNEDPTVQLYHAHHVALEGANVNNYLRNYIQDDSNEFLNSQKNILALRYICMQEKIKFVSLNSNKLKHNDLARDLLHPGTMSNAEFSEEVAALI